MTKGVNATHFVCMIYAMMKFVWTAQAQVTGGRESRRRADQVTGRVGSLQKELKSLALLAA
ncbi:MAG TPA: hypothetical protein VKJ45_12565 [Blastocatellia bacterium]|nr:hypothetical protein [Blastocatellia bacterium]